MTLIGQCKYFVVCRRLGAYPIGDEIFCVLHLPPGSEQNVEAFQEAFEAHLKFGRCDFRWIRFPAAMPNLSPFEGRRFSAEANFREMVLPGGTLGLANAHFEEGVVLGGARVPNVNMNGASVKGSFKVDAERFENTLDLNGGTIDGPVDIKVRQSRFHFRATSAHLNAGLTIEAKEIGVLDLLDTEVREAIKISASCHSPWNLTRAMLPKLVDLSKSEMHGRLSFEGAIFDEECALNLEQMIIAEDLILAGPRIIPHEINVDGIVVNGNASVKADLQARAPRLLARENRPRFGKAVEFTNVDLTECLLVGNAFQKMEFSRVIWPRRAGRYLLFDEIALRDKGRDIPLDGLEEAYQILKQKSQQGGHHAHAGDAHYGELEMRRHARGAVGSIFCLEFLYWLLSGYGTRPFRGLMALTVLTVTAAVLYTWLGDAKTPEEALRLSLAVSTLQKREGTTVGSWVQILHTVFAAIILALLVLAVRMRMKR